MRWSGAYERLWRGSGGSVRADSHAGGSGQFPKIPFLGTCARIHRKQQAQHDVQFQTLLDSRLTQVSPDAVRLPVSQQPEHRDDLRFQSELA
jgi:hypothetical protein